MKLRSVLSIAGSDSSGGAGIQADIKTIQAMGLFAQTAITAITAQNTMGVAAVHDIPLDIVKAQIDAVFDDIRPDAVKIGMVSSADIARVIGEALEEHGAEHVVVDPVMVATSGSPLAADGAVEGMRTYLFPHAEIITPNLAEAQVLAGFEIRTADDAVRAGRLISDTCGAAVLIKGGHGLKGPVRAESEAGVCADDVLCLPDGSAVWYYGVRVDNPNTHGTGCTLSSAIAAGLTSGYDVLKAVGKAKEYLTNALEAWLDLGKGSGPLDHFWAMR